MATLIEIVGSREQLVSTEDPSYPLKLQVFGEDCYDDNVVRTMVEAYIPAFFITGAGSLPFQRYQLHDQGAGNWLVEVYYGRKYPRKPGALYIHFDYTTEKFRTFTSLSSKYYPALKDPNQVKPATGYASTDFQSTINFFKSINVKDSGGKRRVEGVEVEDPAFNFTITRLFGPNYPLTQTFMDNLKALRGKVNADVVQFQVYLIQGITPGYITFYFQPGELQYHGATGGLDEDTHQEVVMRFSSYENIDFVNNFVPNYAGIPNVVKKGFEYIWVAYDEDRDTVTVPGGSGVSGPIGNSGRVVPKPRQVCVETVFREAPLSPLFQ